MAQILIHELADLAGVERGMIAAHWRRSLRTMLEDIADRPGVESARQVQLIMRAVPITNESGELVEIRTEFEIDAKLPKTRTRVYSMSPIGDRGEVRGMQYNDISPGDARQMTIDQAMGPSETEE